MDKIRRPYNKYQKKNPILRTITKGVGERHIFRLTIVEALETLYQERIAVQR